MVGFVFIVFIGVTFERIIWKQNSLIVFFIHYRRIWKQKGDSNVHVNMPCNLGRVFPLWNFLAPQENEAVGKVSTLCKGSFFHLCFEDSLVLTTYTTGRANIKLSEGAVALEFGIPSHQSSWAGEGISMERPILSSLTTWDTHGRRKEYRF